MTPIYILFLFGSIFGSYDYLPVREVKTFKFYSMAECHAAAKAMIAAREVIDAQCVDVSK